MLAKISETIDALNEQTTALAEVDWNTALTNEQDFVNAVYKLSLVNSLSATLAIECESLAAKVQRDLTALSH